MLQWKYTAAWILWTPFYFANAVLHFFNVHSKPYWEICSSYRQVDGCVKYRIHLCVDVPPSSHPFFLLLIYLCVQTLVLHVLSLPDAAFCTAFSVSKRLLLNVCFRLLSDIFYFSFLMLSPLAVSCLYSCSLLQAHEFNHVSCCYQLLHACCLLF